MAFFSTSYEPSDLYQSKSYIEQSPPSVRGCMWQIWLWCGIITFCDDVTELGVFWHMIFEGEPWRETDPKQHAYWTQPNFLTHVAHLLKLQEIQNLSQKSCLIDQFYWIWLLKRTRNGLFELFLDQIIVKSWPFFALNSAELVGNAMSLCHWWYFLMVQRVSYVYENFPSNTFLLLTGLNRNLVILSRNIIRKGVTTQCHSNM